MADSQDSYGIAASLNQADEDVDSGRSDLAELSLYSLLTMAGQTSLDRTDRETILILDKLLAIVRKPARYADALILQKQNVALKEKVFGRGDERTLDATYDLAEILHDQGQLGEDMTLDSWIEASLRRHLLSLDTTDQERIRIQDKLLAIARKFERHAEALELQRQNLALRKKVFGSEHEMTLGAMYDLAETLRNQGQLDKATRLMERTLELQQIKLGPEATKTVRSLASLAALYRLQNALPRARKVYEVVLGIYKQQRPENDPDILFTEHTLSFIVDEEARLDGAELDFRQALAAREQDFHPYHPTTWSILSSLSAALNAQGKHKEAERIDRELLAAVMKDEAPQAPPALKAIRSLIGTLLKQGKVDEAGRLLLRGMFIVDTMPGEEKEKESEKAAMRVLSDRIEDATEAWM